MIYKKPKKHNEFLKILLQANFSNKPLLLKFYQKLAIKIFLRIIKKEYFLINLSESPFKQLPLIRLTYGNDLMNLFNRFNSIR